ncbi:serine/threonine-protein kinase [Candidatus Uabimicrobium sp. HlEnr_7]|uniref:serine/threonine-protein kinase n=1 Tax=Candidatus Uabimicrobium helgolandensis TaxID=3095367 RepID=UPI003558DAA6
MTKIIIQDRYQIQKEAESISDYTRSFIARDLESANSVLIEIFTKTVIKKTALEGYLDAQIKLQHPNIFKIDNWGVHNGLYYFVSEYSRKVTLSAIVSSGKCVLPRKAQQLAIQILKALEYTHSLNIAHKSISLSNILITENKEIKVRGFFEYDFLKTLKENIFTFSGSTVYMSYETLLEGHRTQANDIYSLGILMYFCLCKHYPFQGSFQETLAQKREDSYMRLQEHNPQLSSPLVKIIEKAMHIDPKERYTATEMIKELKSLDKSL